MLTNPNLTTEELETKMMSVKINSFNPAKWDTEKYVESANEILSNDRSNINWYILRYSDVLLLFAEAEAESDGVLTDAIDAVNRVRERAFGNSDHNLASYLNKDELLQAIRDERAYELCFEGHRRQDLIRWGVYYETIKSTAQALSDWNSNAFYPAARYTIEGKHELFPIPQRDMDLLTSYEQNPLWTE